MEYIICFQAVQKNYNHNGMSCMRKRLSFIRCNLLLALQTFPPILIGSKLIYFLGNWLQPKKFPPSGIVDCWLFMVAIILLIHVLHVLFGTCCYMYGRCGLYWLCNQMCITPTHTPVLSPSSSISQMFTLNRTPPPVNYISSLCRYIPLSLLLLS